MCTRTYRASPPSGATLGLGRGRCADVAGRVGRRLAPAVDRVEFLVRVAREDEVVVQQVVVAAVEPQVEHHARTGRLVAPPPLELAARRDGRGAARDGSARRRSWRRRPPAGSAGRRRSRRPVTLARRRRGRSRGSPTPVMQLDAQLARQADQGVGDGPGPAPRIPDTLAGLHVGDPAEHGRREVGRRADVLGEMVEHLRDPAVGDERADRRPDRAPRPHPEDVARASRGWPPSRGRTCRAVRRPTARRNSDARCRRAARRDRGSDRIRAPEHRPARTTRAPRPSGAIGVQVERRAVVEERPPLRVERDQIQLVGQLAAGLGEDPLQHRRHQQDRRPHVEAVAVDLEHRGLAAEPVVLLEDDDLVAPRGQRAGRRQAASPPPITPIRPSLVVRMGCPVSIASRISRSVQATSIRLAQMRARHLQPREVSRIGGVGPSIAHRHGRGPGRAAATVIRADSKITGSPLPGCVPPPTR